MRASLIGLVCAWLCASGDAETVLVRLRQGTAVRATAVTERGELLLIDTAGGERLSVRRGDVVELRPLVAPPRQPLSAASARPDSRRPAPRPRRRGGAMSVMGEAGMPRIAQEADAQDAAAEDNDEARWRRRAGEARGRLASLEREQAELQARKDGFLGLQQTILREGGQPFATADLTIVEAKLQTVTKQVAAALKVVSDLEEEARRAGIPRGWVR